jgi:hypothetical protein
VARLSCASSYLCIQWLAAAITMPLTITSIHQVERYLQLSTYLYQCSFNSVKSKQKYPLFIMSNTLTLVTSIIQYIFNKLLLVSMSAQLAVCTRVTFPYTQCRRPALLCNHIYPHSAHNIPPTSSARKIEATLKDRCDRVHCLSCCTPSVVAVGCNHASEEQQKTFNIFHTTGFK